MGNKQAHVVIVGYDCPSGEICGEILGANSEKAAQDLAEKHWQAWLKALPGNRKLQWSGNFAQEDYLNIPYYRIYPAELFEQLRCHYPHHAAFIDELWKPSVEERAKQLLEMHAHQATYAEAELKKLGYVYSRNEGIWYPPSGIKV